MQTKVEMMYEDAFRGLDGQATDLESIRSHANLALSAGGVAAAFLVTQNSGKSIPLFIAAGAFVLVAVITVRLGVGVAGWTYDFTEDDPGDLADSFPNNVNDPNKTDHQLMYDLAMAARAGFVENKAHLKYRWKLHNWALGLFALEVLALLAHMIVT